MFTNRIARHIESGDVRLGDFMRTLEAMIAGRVKTRPPGRKMLQVGDRGRYATRDGRHVLAWRVTAVDGGVTYLGVEFCAPSASSGTQIASVTFETFDCEVSFVVGPGGVGEQEANEAVRELFLPATDANLLPELAKIDLWDWLPGSLMHGRKIAPYDDSTGHEWLVTASPTSFIWDSSLHTVRPVGSARLDMRRVTAMFVRPPTLQTI